MPFINGSEQVNEIKAHLTTWKWCEVEETSFQFTAWHLMGMNSWKLTKELKRKILHNTSKCTIIEMRAVLDALDQVDFAWTVLRKIEDTNDIVHSNGRANLIACNAIHLILQYAVIFGHYSHLSYQLWDSIHLKLCIVYTNLLLFVRQAWLS